MCAIASLTRINSRINVEYEAYLVELLQAEGVNLVVLAGYMRLWGEVFLKACKDRIVNIHPSLLPSFLGLNAQRRALEYGVKYSGVHGYTWLMKAWIPAPSSCSPGAGSSG